MKNMPVEIRELQIIAVVQEEGAQTSGDSAAIVTSNSEEIIAACVEHVLEILKQKNER
jgi:hypothetical protein